MIPLGLFLLACVTAFLGTVEAAFSVLMRLSLRLMAERGGRDDRLGYYLDEPLRLFIPVRLLLAACIVLAALLIASSTRGEGAVPVVLLFLGLGVFTVLFEHLVPSLIARRDPELVLDAVLPVFDWLARPLLPVTMALCGLLDRHRPGEREASGAGESRPGPREADTETQPDRAISDEESRELLQSIVDFTETLVKEVMTPRPDIVAIHADATLAEVRTLFREEQYSRIPVYRESLDNVLGIVFVKDLVALPPSAEPALTTLMRAAYFVPESKRVSELLKELQRKQAHMAIVVDEYGGTAGLVTVEDLLEEIVGEIRDEYDVESETVTDEGHGSFVFRGKVSIDEVADRLHVRIEREGFETVGGYLLSHLGRMPYLGETFDVDDLHVEVLEVERRRITKIRVRRLEAADERE
ncbi:MAG: HlyC/CorC family transporter [Acidimicrobiia bacterium]|nr:HlyC/CorC family transporter [Acidimicrobiia bacterium]